LSLKKQVSVRSRKCRATEFQIAVGPEMEMARLANLGNGEGVSAVDRGA